MLKIYPFIIETRLLRLFAPLVRQIERRDSDLARQLRRAASSIALNTAEAVGVSGGNERLRFRTALGSTQEVRACLDVAEVFEHLETIDEVLRDRLDRIAASSIDSPRESVQDRADRMQLRIDLRIEHVDVAERHRNVDASSRLFRTSERDVVEHRTIATSRVTAFGDVQRDAARRSSEADEQDPNLAVRSSQSRLATASASTSDVS